MYLNVNLYQFMKIWARHLFNMERLEKAPSSLEGDIYLKKKKKTCICQNKIKNYDLFHKVSKKCDLTRFNIDNACPSALRESSPHSPP